MSTLIREAHSELGLPYASSLARIRKAFEDEVLPYCITHEGGRLELIEDVDSSVDAFYIRSVYEWVKGRVNACDDWQDSGFEGYKF